MNEEHQSHTKSRLLSDVFWSNGGTQEILHINLSVKCIHISDINALETDIYLNFI